MSRFTVKHEDREMEVIIPNSGDKSYDAYLEEAEREKTLDQLKKRGKREKTKLKQGDISGALKEYAEFKKRKASEHPKKYW